MKKILLVLLLLPGVLPILANTPPRLVINLVVSSMRPDDIDRYRSQFGTGGFLRLTEGGARFTEGSYDYQQTSTPVSLATLTTGAMPSTHGVISTRWRDYIVNKTVGLIDDPTSAIPNTTTQRRLLAPQPDRPDRRGGPAPAISRQSVGNRSSRPDFGRGDGRTRRHDLLDGQRFLQLDHLHLLPARFTGLGQKIQCGQTLPFLHRRTVALPAERRQIPQQTLFGHRLDEFHGQEKAFGRHLGRRRQTDLSKAPSESRYDNILYSPAGNCLTLQFAKTALTQLDLGKRDRTDLLNICLDAPRAIREAYGPESIEAEDMYYRLDQDLEEFLTYVYTLFKPHEVLVILTSDHGSSPSYDFGREACDRFNTRQFEVIVNGFLSARYGPGNWVLEYEDKCLYLNHNLVYEKDLSLADIQNEVATFAMQFRGVSHALSATAMRTSYFGSGYARKMQNSFYPRRSGDVIINLMPGWIEEHDHKRSSSGSMYGYDTRVPLIFYGAGILPRQIDRPVDMTAVAPTLCRLLGIEAPAASEGTVLEEVISSNI